MKLPPLDTGFLPMGEQGTRENKTPWTDDMCHLITIKFDFNIQCNATDPGKGNTGPTHMSLHITLHQKFLISTVAPTYDKV